MLIRGELNYTSLFSRLYMLLLKFIPSICPCPIPLIMNQKAFQPGPDKGINNLLYLFPITAMVAEHQLIDSQAAVHLEIKYGFRFLKSKNTVGHKPGNIMLLVVRHPVNDPAGNRIIQKKRAESIIAVNPIAKGVGAA